jgi:hypothetical protein
MLRDLPFSPPPRELIVRLVEEDSALAQMQVFERAVSVEIEWVTKVFRRIWVPLMLSVALDLAVTPCVRAAIEETTALEARAQEV